MEFPCFYVLIFGVHTETLFLCVDLELIPQCFQLAIPISGLLLTPLIYLSCLLYRVRVISQMKYYGLHWRHHHIVRIYLEIINSVEFLPHQGRVLQEYRTENTFNTGAQLKTEVAKHFYNTISNQETSK